MGALGRWAIRGTLARKFPKPLRKELARQGSDVSLRELRALQKSARDIRSATASGDTFEGRMSAALDPTRKILELLGDHPRLVAALAVAAVLQAEELIEPTVLQMFAGPLNETSEIKL